MKNNSQNQFASSDENNAIYQSIRPMTSNGLDDSYDFYGEKLSGRELADRFTMPHKYKRFKHSAPPLLFPVAFGFAVVVLISSFIGILASGGVSGNGPVPIIMFTLFILVFGGADIFMWVSWIKERKYNIVKNNISKNGQLAIGRIQNTDSANYSVNNVTYHKITFKFFNGVEEISIESGIEYFDWQTRIAESLKWIVVKYVGNEAVIVDKRIHDQSYLVDERFATDSDVPAPDLDHIPEYLRNPDTSGYSEPQMEYAPPTEFMKGEGESSMMPEGSFEKRQRRSTTAKKASTEGDYYTPSSSEAQSNPTSMSPFATDIEAKIRQISSIKALDEFWFNNRSGLSNDEYTRLVAIYERQRHALR